jgi:hypothetical protein
MKIVPAVTVVLIVAVFLISLPSGNAQEPEPLPEPEYLYYMPYVAKPFWDIDSGWYLTDLHTDDGINYYAELSRGGWVVEGRNRQVPNWQYWVPPLGAPYQWGGHYFWSPTGSWHPPFYLDFYAVRIISRPDQ